MARSARVIGVGHVLFTLIVCAPDASAERLPITTYTAIHGLAATDVNAAVEDAQGFLWIGSDTGFNAPIWNPGGAAGVPFRPDFDFGEARSELERTPAASFLAKAPVRFEPPNPKSLLPSSLDPLLSKITVELWVEVTPSFQADYAAQFGLMSREGRLGNACQPGKGEFGQTCGAAESAVGLQAGALAEVTITGTVHFKLAFCCLGPFTPGDINVTKSFKVPLPSPDRTWDPPRIEDAPMAHQSSRVGWAIHTAMSPKDTLWQGVKGLSGATAGDVRAWTQACLATPPKNAGPPPPPSHEPDGDDLVPELLPCNLCVADSRQTQYNPFKLFEVTNYKPGVQASVCEWEPNAGCYDLCSWNGKSWNQVEVSAVTILGEKCAQHRPPVVK